MSSGAQSSFADMYRSHPVYSGMLQSLQRAGALPVEMMRVTQADFDAVDPATRTLSLGILLDADAKSLSVDFGEGRKLIAIPSDLNGIYVNPTWNDTRFEQYGSATLQFVSISFDAIADHLEMEASKIAHSLSPYYDRLARDKRMRARLLDLWHLGAMDCPAAVLAVDHAMLSVAAKLLDRLGVLPHSDGVDRVLSAHEVERVSHYVEDHLEESISLAELAQVVGRNAYAFARGFARTVSMTPHQYVMMRRIARGRRLIEQHRDMGLAEIAFACGFSNQPHFSVVFKRFVGVSPGQYRILVNDA